jgi:hypothetical protein
MIALLLAALLQTAPDAAGPATQGDGLPKSDYERVAWCHGALAGQLELEPIAHADMEKIEGKAKVAARAKDDAEMVKERRQYLKDYEQALAAAEAASPTMIHPKGVAAEQQGYRLWAGTRNKEPVWRILDWGMWDPNDAGCSEAASRLLNKSQLFGAALKSDDKPEAAETPPAEAPAPEMPAPEMPVPETPKPTETVAEAPPPPPADKPAEPLAAEASPATETPTVPADASAEVAPEPPPKAALPKKAKIPVKVAKVAPKPKPNLPTASAEAIREAIANGKAELEKPAAPPADAAAPADPAPLRGPQQP